MKNLILIALLLIGMQIHVNAQRNIDQCGYIPDQEYLDQWKNQNSIKNKRLNFLKKFPLKDLYKIKGLEYRNQKFQLAQPSDIRGNIIGLDHEEEDLLDTMITIPIVAQVVRKTNKSGGISEASIDDAISIANSYYNGMNMEFEVCQIVYINSDDLYNNTFDSDDDNANNSNSSYNVLNVSSRNISQRLNIYFVPNSNTSWTWRPNSIVDKQHIMLLNSQASNGSTVSHEIGHWFDLLHTHDEGDELVDGSNCAVAGDFVCDTPADPNLSKLVDSSCNYTGGSSIVDANGDTYNPDPRNLLSYSTKSCRNRFSEGQYYRMQSAYLGIEADRGYTLDPCNGVGDKIAGYKWTEGWTNTEFYEIDGQTYLFLLKQKGLSGSDKNVHIHEMNSDGKVGSKIAGYKWTEGWTSTEFFTIGSQTYLFLLKEEGLSGSDKNVHIHKMNSDGKVGSKIADYKWTGGWSNVEFYTIGGQVYLFLLKEKGYSGSDKNVHIHKMNSDGKVGDRVVDYKWTEGWTNTEFYSIGGDTYLFLLKEDGYSGSDKNIHIHEMNSDGKVGSRISDYKWTEGWTGTEFYTLDNVTYLFLLKEKGLSGTNKTTHIHSMESNGSVGIRAADYKWSECWTNSEFYYINNKTYLFLLKQKGLSGSKKNVHIHNIE